MKKIITLILAIIGLGATSANAQMFTASPAPLQESSEDVVITFHADLSGVAALTNLPPTTNLYAHIGVYTTKSPNSWSHVVTTWGIADPDHQFVYVAPNTYELPIGDLRAYFDVTDPDEHITNVCIIARTASGGAQTSDQFIDVVGEGFKMELSSNATSNILTAPTAITFSVNATQPAELTLKVNGNQIAHKTGATNLSQSYTFQTKGSYTVTAEAKSASGEVQSSSLHFIYPGQAVAADYPGGIPKMGAVKNSDGTVTFCLAAPNKSSVILMPSWDNYEPLEKNVMKYHDYQGQRYFWVTVSGLDNTTDYLYYYVIDGKTNVADPYCHLALDCYNDKWLSKTVFPNRPAYPYDRFDDIMLSVYRGNLDDYNWKCNNFVIPEHSSLNIYELLFRDFTGKNSQADGTVRAAIEKIPYLVELGVNAVELMPIMEFNGNNSWGYNTNFYMAPDKAYGSPEDYKEFIDLCHQNGIAVILDIVFNQADGLHPWYQMYPIESNPFFNQYAPHDYSVLNDWKQENPLVQKQWEDAIRYWMQVYRVDGFRFDLVKGLGISYPGGTEAYNTSRIQVMKNLHAVIKSVNPNALHINENLAGAAEENAMGADGQLNWSNINDPACQYAMGWDENCNLHGFHAPNWGRTIGTTVAYAESHDEQRMGYKQTKWGHSSVKGNEANSMLRLGSVAAQMLMTPGAKMVWQFGELGADQSTKTDDGGNDTSPKKVVWNYLDNADRKGLHDTYKDLMWVRKQNPELFRNNANITMNGFSNSLAGVRSITLRSGNKEIVMIANPSVSSTANASVPVQYINASGKTILSSSYGFSPSVNVSGGNLTCTIPPHCYVVVGSGSVVGIESPVIASDNVSVTTVNGQIVVLGDYKHAVVCDLSGRTYSIDASLPAGMYIVNIDGRGHKVLVR